MPRDLRMSRILHVLIHLDRHVPRATSDEISRMIFTNPVVVRRMMGGLRDRGIVSSEKGHGGGWQLAKPLADVTLRDVYEAVGAPPLFNIGPRAEPAVCLVERAVDARLDTSFAGGGRLACSNSSPGSPSRTSPGTSSGMPPTVASARNAPGASPITKSP